MVGEYVLFSVDLKGPSSLARLILWGQPFWECLCLRLGLALLIDRNVPFGSVVHNYLTLPFR